MVVEKNYFEWNLPFENIYFQILREKTTFQNEQSVKLLFMSYLKQK